MNYGQVVNCSRPSLYLCSLYVKIFVKVAQSWLTLCDPIQSMEFSRPEYWSEYPFLSPGDLSNPGLPHCRWSLYQLSNKGSPRILDWVAYLFSSRSSWPRNWTGVSCIGGGFFTTEPSGSPDMFTVCVVLKICSLYGVLYAHSLKNKTKNIVPDLPNEVTYRSYYTNSIYCVV